MDVAVLVDTASKAEPDRHQQRAVERRRHPGRRAATRSACRRSRSPSSRSRPGREGEPDPDPARRHNYAKYVALGLGILLFLFFVTRALRNRERSSLGEPTWLSEISSPRSVAELGDGSHAALAAGASQRPADRLGSQDPALVAQQLRTWMAED